MGAHGVLLLAVSEKPFQQATEYVRSNGTVVAIGMPANAYLKAAVFNTVVRTITIKGSYVGNRHDAAEAIDFFARGLIKAPFVVRPLEELPHIFQLMCMLFVPLTPSDFTSLLTCFFPFVCRTAEGKIAGRYVLKMPE